MPESATIANKLQVNYGLLTDARGCPVAVSVFEGKIADSETLLPQARRLSSEFAIDTMVIVGDRGMISQKAIDELRETQAVAWITALKSVQTRALLEDGMLRLALFDERNLFELAHPEFPGERLVVCRNPELAELRAHKHRDLLEATTVELRKVRSMVERKRLRGRDRIGMRVGRVVNKYNSAKHFELEIEDERFAFRILKDQVATEALLDGIYMLRPPVPSLKMDSAQVMRSYKSLAQEMKSSLRTTRQIRLSAAGTSDSPGGAGFGVVARSS